MTNNIERPGQIQSANAVSTHDLLVAIGKRKWIYLLLLLVCGSLSFWLLKYKVYLYTSQASFYISESVSSTNVSQNQTFTIPEILTPGQQYDRAFQLISSSKVHEHLIKKFNLLKHYKIDTTKEFHYEKAVAILESRIKIKKSPNNLISVFVSDTHRYLAADMANEALEYLDELNKNLIIRSMRQKLEIYDVMLKSTEKDNAKRSEYFNEQLSKLDQTLDRIEKQDGKGSNTVNLQLQLSQLISTIQRSTEDVIRMRINYSLALQSIEESNLPSIVVIHKARPSPRSLGLQSLLISGIICFLLLSGLVYSVYIKLRYKNYFKVLMNNNGPNQELKIEHKEAR